MKLDAGIEARLSAHIFAQGFTNGLCLDITVKAFGKEYRLHRLVLAQCEYFASWFSGPWAGLLTPTEVDLDVWEASRDVVTVETFELILERLYGLPRLDSELSHDTVCGVLVVAQFLGLSDVVELAVAYVLEHIGPQTVGHYLRFATGVDDGSGVGAIVEAGLGVLACDGWQMGVEAWDDVPAVHIAYIVASDCFFVPTEWHRCVFLIKLIDRRVETERDEDSVSCHLDLADEAETLRAALNSGIHFCNLTAEQLESLELLRDPNNTLHVDPRTLQQALWVQTKFQRRIVTASDTPFMGLTQEAETRPTEGPWFQVPAKDATVNGTPRALEAKMHLPVVENESHSQSGTAKVTLDPQRLSFTDIPPFRFLVAFPDVLLLVTERRVYAKTLWYAGLYWNVYLQKLRNVLRKSYQIGVYLHRALLPASSRNGLLNPDVFSQDVEDLGTQMQSVSLEEPETAHKRAFWEYEDPRTRIAAYFVIYTPLRKANAAVTSFSSAPDVFKVSQSWGWKSNSMCVFDEHGRFPPLHDPLLKFMVVLGYV